MRPWTWVALASGPAAVLLWFLAGTAPATVEAVYSRIVYPALMAPWSRLWGTLPFAVAPWLALLIVVGLGATFWFQPWPRALALVASTLSVLVAWFVLAWGLNYQRQSWGTNHGWVVTGGTVHDLEALAQRLAQGASERREGLEPFDGGTADLRSAVSRAWERAGAQDALLAGRYGDPKAVGGDAMSWLGLAGICIPFTGEPLINAGPRDWQLPFTAAHEAAHLRGWAREDEANFLAFWVLRDDPDARLSYSAWSSALLYVASALEATGPEGQVAWARVAATLPATVRDDWRQSFAYWDRFRGPAAEVTQAVNDVYLKSQGQSDGVRSYGRMVDLLLASERSFAPEVR